MTAFLDQLAGALTEIEHDGQLRRLVPVTHLDRGRIDIDGRTCLNLAGNDYLGLAANPALLRAFYAEQAGGGLLENYGLGSTASRLSRRGSNTSCFLPLATTISRAAASTCQAASSARDALRASATSVQGILFRLSTSCARWHEVQPFLR